LILEPGKVVPVNSTLSQVKPDFIYTLPPNSVVVLKLKGRP